MKPREKLFKYGAGKLTNSELLAVILGHATKKEDVFHLSKRLLNEYGQKTICGITNAVELQKFYDIGKVHAAKIISCFELGKRFYKKDRSKNILSSPKEVFEYTHHMRELNREYMYGLYLNTKSQVLHEEVLSIGTLEKAHIYIRDIFYPALIHHAYGIILVHNHPSGDEKPSHHDILVTNEVKEASEIMGIQLLDHIIVTKAKYFSFNDQNLLIL